MLQYYQLECYSELRPTNINYMSLGYHTSMWPATFSVVILVSAIKKMAVATGTSCPIQKMAYSTNTGEVARTTSQCDNPNAE